MSRVRCQDKPPWPLVVAWNTPFYEIGRLVKVEYLRLQFDSSSATAFTAGMLNPAATVPHRYDVSGSDNIVRVGVNYRFGGPIVAKY